MNFLDGDKKPSKFKPTHYPATDGGSTGTLTGASFQFAALDAAPQLRHHRSVETRCSQCGAAMTCQPEGGCWCADLPLCVPIPSAEAQVEGCLCRNCLLAKIEALKQSAKAKQA